MPNLTQSYSRLFETPAQVQPKVVSGGRGAGTKGTTFDDKYFGIPEAPAGLDYTGAMDAQSQELHKRWSDLRNFAHSMESLYGIDVTRPDGRPEAVAANQAFKQELGNIQYGIDRLKQSGDMAAQLLPMFAAGTATPGAQYGQAPTSTLMPQDAYSFTGLTEPSEKVITSLSRPYDRKEDYDRAVQQGQAYVQSLRAAGRTREADDVEKALNPSINVERSSSADDKTNRSAFEYLKRISAVIRGATADYKVSQEYNDPSTDEPLTTTTAFNDGFEGFNRKTGTEVKGIIQQVLRNNKSGALYLKLSTSDDLVPVSGTELMYGISKANPKYPTVDKLSAFLGQFGGSDQVGEIQPEFFLESSAIKKADENISKMEKDAAKVTAEDAELDNLIGSAYQGGWWSRGVHANTKTGSIPSLGGIVIDFQRGDVEDGESEIVLSKTAEASIRKQLLARGLTPQEAREQLLSLETKTGLRRFLKKYRPVKSTTGELDEDI